MTPSFANAQAAFATPCAFIVCATLGCARWSASCCSITVSWERRRAIACKAIDRLRPSHSAPRSRVCACRMAITSSTIAEEASPRRSRRR
jgi:hypothetical protein